MKPVPQFRCALSRREVEALAARYVATNASQEREDRLFRLVGPRARARGFLRRSEFLLLCDWKSPRSRPLVRANSAAAVTEVSRAALAAVDEVERGAILCRLTGVGWPTASAILHVVLPDRWPLVDVRALETLGVVAPSAYTRPFVAAYVAFCRDLASSLGVSLRTLDRALGQASKEGVTV